MAQNKPDMDLLALGGLIKSGLRDIDGSRVGGSDSTNSDKIDMKQLAGIKPKNRGGERPNMLKGLDFIEAPKSRPLGAVDMDGAPVERNVDFMPIPEDLQENVQQQLEMLADEPVAPQSTPRVQPTAVQPAPEGFDFDLFQFSTLKEIIKNLDSSIGSVEDVLSQLKNKREMIFKMIDGDSNE